MIKLLAMCQNDCLTAGKGSGDKNPTQQNTDALRNAKIRDMDDPSMKEMVCKVIEMTERPEEHVCFALHECEFDVNLAVNLLLESTDPDWVISVKKKTKRQAASTNKTESTNTEGGDGGTDDGWNEVPPAPANNEREKSRTRGGGPPRMRGGRGGCKYSHFFYYSKLNKFILIIYCRRFYQYLGMFRGPVL